MIGIICEFNPFHYGHRYLIQKAKEAFPDQPVICVMSGNYVQRGEPAFLDKMTRTRMALLGGADLVLELPTYYAAATAEKFAFGACHILASTGLVTSLVFGMEDPSNLPLLKQAASLLVDHDSPYPGLLKEKLPKTSSYALARSEALSLLLGRPLPAGPNEILALEYLCALRRLSFNPEILPVRRTIPHTDSLSDQTGLYASSSAIRRKAMEGLDISDDLPENTNSEYVFPSRMFPALIYRLCFHDASSLAKIDEIEEGLENRILHSAREAASYDELLSGLKTKRYTTSRLRRILLNILLDITKERKEALSFAEGPDYIRVLGIKKEHLSLLGALSESSTLPIVTSLNHDLSSLSEKAVMMLEDELLFSRIYRSLLKDPSALSASEKSVPLMILSQ